MLYLTFYKVYNAISVVKEETDISSCLVFNCNIPSIYYKFLSFYLKSVGSKHSCCNYLGMMHYTPVLYSSSIDSKVFFDKYAESFEKNLERNKKIKVLLFTLIILFIIGLSCYVHTY